MTQVLKHLALNRDSSCAIALASVCCSHPMIIKAALRYARKNAMPVLIEATCNQVNHLGGYTGMQPQDFADQVIRIAQEQQFDTSQLILGGDHLGPNPWRNLSALEAMEQAEMMVIAYAKAGFNKFHLDASMRCADDPEVLEESVVAKRAARLASAIEGATSIKDTPAPVYVIGTEVPPPGGANHVINSVTPTDPQAAINTVTTHRKVFQDMGLESAFERVIALVVQPGVEFGDVNVHQYRPEKATGLCAVLDAEPSICFEAHSTDYQTAESLSQLARDGYRVQKVGPWLSFALREALYALDRIATEIDTNYPENALRLAMETLMNAKPAHWQNHYTGSARDMYLARHYSYSDRIRYYWAAPEAEEAVAQLFNSLSGKTIPETLISQYLPASWRLSITAPLSPEDLVLDAIERVLGNYPLPYALVK